MYLQSIDAKKFMFLKQNEMFKVKVNVFCFCEVKKGFPFVSLRSENKLVEVKPKIGSEKKRKKRTVFFKWTSETNAKGIQFRFISLISEKKISVKGRSLQDMLAIFNFLIVISFSLSFSILYSYYRRVYHLYLSLLFPTQPYPPPVYVCVCWWKLERVLG